jgi:gamma-glutamyltranspeptidase/glutathione hydrolase
MLSNSMCCRIQQTGPRSSFAPCRSGQITPELRRSAKGVRSTAGPLLLAVCVLPAISGVARARDVVVAAPVHPPGPRSHDSRSLPQARAVSSAYGMVASGIPEASRAGARILEEGGNAVDAAIATAFALGVVDPFNAGLGGQCYVLVHLRDGSDVAIDGSASVPFHVVPEDLRPLKESEHFWGYKVAATPATPAALAYTLQRYGTMTLAQVLAPAIELAEFGSTFVPTTQAVIAHYADRTRENEFLARTFLNDGLDPFPPGHVYCQPALAATFRRLAQRGVRDFYHGSTADEIAADMAANGGYITKLDLALPHVNERVPIRGTYRGLEVVAFPRPGAGEILINALQILNVFPPELLRRDTVDRLNLLLEVTDLALRMPPEDSRQAFMGSAFLDPARAARQARRIRLDRALTDDELPAIEQQAFNDRETTHVSVVDGFGNAVALTQTLGYGAYVATPSLGFEYNSLLDGCDLCDPSSPAYPLPLRTFATSMTPTIILCQGEPYLVLGSAGSSRIPAMIVDVVTNIVDRGMSLRDAVVAPRALSTRPNPIKKRKGCRTEPSDLTPEEKTYLEVIDPITLEQADALARRGFLAQKRVSATSSLFDRRSFGGVNAVMRDPATGLLVGVGDPRRHGAAAAPSPH